MDKKFLSFLFFCLLAIYSPAAFSENKPSLLVISIDGLRPDVLLRSDAPALRSLMSTGSFTFYAKTTDVAVTLPSHVSMLTGVSPEKHGVLWNNEQFNDHPRYPSVPTLFEVAKASGYSTAMVAGKARFVALTKPGSLDWQFLPGKTIADGDSEIASQAISIITKHKPQVLFVHLPHVDVTGHAEGWGSAAQLAAVTLADKSVAEIVAAFRATTPNQEPFVIISTDHGGEQKGHGVGSSPSHFIPLILAGPGIRKNYDLTLSAGQISIEDIFATACRMLGIKPSENTEGKIIGPAFDGFTNP